jgi:hypothetical protein
LAALLEAGYWRLDQLTDLSEAEVKQLHGVGPKALAQLRHALGVRVCRLPTGSDSKKTGGDINV